MHAAVSVFFSRAHEVMNGGHDPLWLFGVQQVVVAVYEREYTVAAFHGYYAVVSV